LLAAPLIVPTTPPFPVPFWLAVLRLEFEPELLLRLAAGFLAPPVAAFERVPDVAAFERVPDVAAFERVPDVAAFERVPDVAAFERVPDVAAFERVPDEVLRELPFALAVDLDLDLGLGLDPALLDVARPAPCPLREAD